MTRTRGHGRRIAALLAALAVSACGGSGRDDRAMDAGADAGADATARGAPSDTAPGSAVRAPRPEVPYVTGAWVRAADAGAMTGGYFVLHNPTDRPLEMRGITATDARSASLHETIRRGTSVSMEARPTMRVAPRDSLVLAPGGAHVMLMGLSATLARGATTELRVRLAGVAEAAAPTGEGRLGPDEDTLVIRAAVRGVDGQPVAGEAPISSVDAAATADTTGRCPRDGRWRECSLSYRLTRSGLLAIPSSDTARVPFFDVAATRWRIGRQEALVLFFADSLRAAEATAALDPVRAAPRGDTAWRWPGAPLLVGAANVVLLVFDAGEETRERIRNALLAGPPQPDRD